MQYSENHLSQPTEDYHQVKLLTLNCKEDWIENGVIKAIRVMKHWFPRNSFNINYAI